MYAAQFAPLSNKESNIFALIMKSRDVVWQCVVDVSMHGYLTLYIGKLGCTRISLPIRVIVWGFMMKVLYTL